MASAQQPAKLSALIVTPDEVPSYSLFGLGEARLLMTGEQSGGAWWMGHFREDPGFVTQLHMHPQTNEQFYVLDGVLSVYIDGSWRELTPGTLAVIPSMTPHAQGNFGTKPVTILGAGNPSGFEKLFPAVDALVKKGISPGDPRFAVEFSAISRRCDSELLGPPPPR